MSQLKDTEINGQNFGNIVEAIIFAADRPLTAADVAKIITETELSPPIDEEDVMSVIDEINAELEDEGRAFTIQLQGGGYTFATQPKYHSWLEQFQHQNAKRKVSPSAIEALAIIAYRQPITKPEVDHIRGVDSGYIVRQLLEKQLIEVAGRYDGPGRALLYRTTPIFLQHFGINSIDELPKPREIEEILKDDDMAEHRQFMLELKSDLQPPSVGSDDDNGDQEDTVDEQPSNEPEDSGLNDPETPGQDEPDDSGLNDPDDRHQENSGSSESRQNGEEDR